MISTTLSSAVAGGGGRLPASVVQVGQIWEITAQPVYGPRWSAQYRVDQEIRTDIPDWQAFGIEGKSGGGGLSFYASERGINLTAFIDQSRIYRCFALWPGNGWKTVGALLSGTVDATNEQLMQAQRGTDMSHQALIAAAKRNGAGSCILKRIR